MANKFLGAAELKKNYETIKAYYRKGDSSFVRSGRIFNYIKSRYPDKNISIVELGCGAGQLANSLYNDNYRRIALYDIGNYMHFEHLNSFFKNIDLSRERINLPDNSADLVISIAVIEHLENPFNLISESRRILKKGGELIIGFPNILTLWDKMLFFIKGDLFRYHEKNDHLFIFTPALFKKFFSKDFELKKVEYADAMIPYLRPTRWNRRLPNSKWLSTKVCYVLKKISDSC